MAPCMSFPSVNPNMVIMPHYDALVLTLYINGFNVYRVLVDLGNAIDLLQIKAPTGEIIEHVIRLDFPASNNEVEYEAIIARINLAISVSSEKIIIRSDSQLVVG